MHLANVSCIIGMNQLERQWTMILPDNINNILDNLQSYFKFIHFTPVYVMYTYMCVHIHIYRIYYV